MTLDAMISSSFNTCLTLLMFVCFISFVACFFRGKENSHGLRYSGRCRNDGKDGC